MQSPDHGCERGACYKFQLKSREGALLPLKSDPYAFYAEKPPRTASVVRGLMTCDPSEVSVLHFLQLVNSAGGLQVLLSIEGGYQQDLVEGGADKVLLAAGSEHL